jgi:hypothetical protein
MHHSNTFADRPTPPKYKPLTDTRTLMNEIKRLFTRAEIMASVLRLFWRLPLSSSSGLLAAAAASTSYNHVDGQSNTRTAAACEALPPSPSNLQRRVRILFQFHSCHLRLMK